MDIIQSTAHILQFRKQIQRKGIVFTYSPHSENQRIEKTAGFFPSDYYIKFLFAIYQKMLLHKDTKLWGICL